MHKYIKQQESNSGAKFEQFCLFDETNRKAKVKREKALEPRKTVTRSKEMDCLSLLGSFHYKTDD